MLHNNNNNNSAPHIISHHGTPTSNTIAHTSSVSNYKRQARMIKASRTTPKYMMKK